MSTRMKKTAAGTVALVAALALTGCQQAPKPGDGLPPLESTSASASSSTPAPSSVAASSPVATPTPTASAFPEFEPVTSKTPGTQEEAQAHAFETVQLLYKVSSAVLNSGDKDNVDRLGVAAQAGLLKQRTATVSKVFEEGLNYQGESKVELIDGLAGPSVNPDGSLIDNASVNLRVCEDNSGVKLTEKDGTPAKTGAPRYVVKYAVLWNEKDGVWSVVSRELPPENGPEETSC